MNCLSVIKLEYYRKQPLIDSIYELGFEQPSKIQEAALPLLLGVPPKDLLAQSQSGTGKTASFLLTVLNQLDPDLRMPQCKCLKTTNLWTRFT